MNFNSQMNQFKQAQMRNFSQPLPAKKPRTQLKSQPKKKHSTPFDQKYADPYSSSYSGVPQKKHQQQLQFAIINKMKERHQEEFTHPLDINEIIDEARLMHVTQMQINRLLTDLPKNPKIKVVEEDGKTKFVYKPKFPIKNKAALLRLLDTYAEEGRGGMLVEDIVEALPKAKIRLKKMEEQEKIVVLMGADKKQIAFRSQTCFNEIKIDERFKAMWRNIPVDGLEEGRIREYLKEEGLGEMEKEKKPVQKKRKKATSRKRKFKMLNDHIGDMLQDYSDKQ